MGHYWHFVDQVWTSEEEYSGCGFGHLRRWHEGNLTFARYLLNLALKQVTNRDEMFRVHMAHDNLQLFELFMKLRRDLAAGRFETIGEDAQRYYDWARDLSVSYKPQFAFGGAAYLGEEKSWYAKYFRSFYKATYEDAARLSSDFEILTRPPLRQWRYQPDKDKQGEAQGWHKPGFGDDAWNTTDTCLETWSSLGYHSYMGVMWYRAQVGVPAAAAGKKTYLWIGATDGSAKLFVNGKHVPYANTKGEEQEAFSGYCAPASWDISGALKSGAKNQIAIRCERTFINELGTGGILGSPVLIYREKQEAGDDAD